MDDDDDDDSNDDEEKVEKDGDEDDDEDDDDTGYGKAGLSWEAVMAQVIGVRAISPVNKQSRYSTCLYLHLDPEHFRITCTDMYRETGLVGSVKSVWFIVNSGLCERNSVDRKRSGARKSSDIS